MSRYTSKHTGKKIDDTIDSVVNPNLLHNGYFANPVNQRKQTEYSCVSTNVYTIDRWRIGNSAGKLLVGTDHIQLVNTSSSYVMLASQVLEQNIVEDTDVTFSVFASELVGDVYIYARSSDDTLAGVATKQKQGVTSVTFNAKNVNRVIIQVNIGASVKLKAVKLELGSQQTLAHQDENGNWVLNEIPNYAEELAKCQRYYIKYGASSAALHVGYAQAVLATQANAMIYLPVPMRANPAIVVSSMPYLRKGVTDIAATEVVMNWASENVVYFAVKVASGLTVGENYVIRLNNATLELDANL